MEAPHYTCTIKRLDGEIEPNLFEARFGGKRLARRLYLNEETWRHSLPFGSHAFDMARVGQAVLAADRLCSRFRRDQQYAKHLAWSRNISLTLPVQHPDRWELVRPRIEALLSFLSDDTWNLAFRLHDRPPRKNLNIESRRTFSPGAEIALFSGGLDSVVGMYARHCETPKCFIAASVYGDGSRKKLLKSTVKALNGLGVTVTPHFVHARLRKYGDGPRVEEEPSQRTRAFQYLLTAGAIAEATNAQSIVTYESGPGALNLRLCEAQVASQNTRAMHPQTLLQMRSILRELLEQPAFEVSAPFLRHTKGDVCVRAGSAVRTLASLAVSCDQGEQRQPSPKHCGFCSSCVLRRVALYESLGDADPTIYTMRESKFHGNRFDTQAYRLHGMDLLAATSSYANLSQHEPDIRFAVRALTAEGYSRAEAEDILCTVLRRHAQQTLAYFAHGDFVTSGDQP